MQKSEKMRYIWGMQNRSKFSRNREKSAEIDQQSAEIDQKSAEMHQYWSVDGDFGVIG